jgi:class 3 adenylate cyclase
VDAGSATAAPPIGHPITRREEDVDRYAIRAFLMPYYAHLRLELQRFGGRVEKFIGDAIMAIFGAPIVHEDDPERAVRAALAIRDWLAEQEGLSRRGSPSRPARRTSRWVPAQRKGSRWP